MNKALKDRYAELQQWTTGQLVKRLLELNPLGGYNHAYPASNEIKRDVILRYEYGAKAVKEMKGEDTDKT